MLCLGNICRSPLAEGIMRSKLPRNYEIDSAGTIAYHEGKMADSRSISVADRYGIDIRKHRARKIMEDDFEVFDKIYCMDQENYWHAMQLAVNEKQRQKVVLILEEAGMEKENTRVPDPYYGDISDFEAVYTLLDEACEKIAGDILKRKE